MKTVIQVWTHRCCNVNDLNFWGLGDMIRGTIRLYQLSKIKNYNFIVDYQLHSISNYLKNNDHQYSDFIRNNSNNINLVYPNNVEYFIDTSTSDIIYFFTNEECDENLDNDTKNFIKNILSPNDLFQSYIDNILNNVPFFSYNILHYRLGDTELIHFENNENLTLMLLNNVKNNLEENDILLSDSLFFKNYIKNNIQSIYMLDVKPCHIGHSFDKDLIKDTFLEFILITKSNKIKTYSIYCWTSGFVHWVHKIYDVQLIKI